MPDLARGLAQLGGVLLLRRRQELTFGGEAEILCGTGDLLGVLDSDLAGFDRFHGLLKARQLPGQLDLLVGCGAGDVAVVAQPADGRAVGCGGVSALAIELLDAPRGLRLHTVHRTVNLLDVGTQHDWRYRAQVLLGDECDSLVDEGDSSLKHLFDFITST